MITDRAYQNKIRDIDYIFQGAKGLMVEGGGMFDVNERMLRIGTILVRLAYMYKGQEEAKDES